LLPIIDNVLNSYLALCQSQAHYRGLLVPANFHEIIEDTEDIQQFANHNRFVRAVAEPAATQVHRTANRSLYQRKSPSNLHKEAINGMEVCLAIEPGMMALIIPLDIRQVAAPRRGINIRRFSTH